MQALAERVLGNQPLELTGALDMPAELEVDGDPILERAEPQILEPSGLAPRERLVGRVGQRRAAPLSARLAQVRGPPAGSPPATAARPRSASASKRRASISSGSARSW